METGLLLCVVVYVVNKNGCGVFCVQVRLVYFPCVENSEESKSEWKFTVSNFRIMLLN